MFRVGDAVDMSTLLTGWAFCGIVRYADEDHCWVHFVDKRNDRIEYERLGAWYKNDLLRISHNPPID